MDEDLARRSHAVLMQALELEESERTMFIRRACADDPTLGAQANRLLAALERSRDFLETPAIDAVRTGAPETPRRAPARIGRYRIVRIIGVGGMATVYEATQERPQRRVALKVMRRGLVQTSAVQRFQFETEVLARLQHAGIAQILEANAWDDGHGAASPYFAMEYIADARTITEFARERGLALVERLRMFAAVCDAVQHGHQHGVIHRDLKPGNILVDSHGCAKVIDFGVARSNDPEQTRITQHTDQGQLIGTLNYMSPEQCSGGADLDIRTDVYSLGVILYELVCARLPHDLSRAPLPEALRRVREDSPVRPSAVDGRLRGEIDAIILMAMEKDRDRRYPTVAAFAADVRRYLSDQPIEARPPTMLRQCRLFVRRNRALVGAVSAVLLVVVVGAALSAGFAYQTALESQRRFAAESKALRERDAARWQGYVGNIAGAFAALQRLEFQQLRSRLEAASEEHRGWEWRFLVGMSELSEQTVVAHEDMIYTFAASADGARLATGCRDGTLRTWDAVRGVGLASSEGTPGAAVHSVAFSPDGRQLVSGSDDRTVRIWDALTGEQVCRLGEHATRIASVSWGPHGEIASASEDGIARLWRSDHGGLHRVLEDQPGGIHGVAFSADGTMLATWNDSGALWLRSADDFAVRHQLAFGDEIVCVAISGDGSRIGAGGREGRVLLWDADRGDLIHQFDISPNASTVCSLAFSPSGDRMAAGQIQRGIVVWDVTDGSRLGQLRGHEEAVSGVWFAPDGDRLVSSSWDRTMRIWSVSADSAGGLITKLTGHEDHVLAATFSPDGSILASAGRDKMVRLWDPELGLELGVLRGHGQDVYSVVFSPDGGLIATGAHDHTVRLWSAATGAHLATLEGHTAPVWSVEFSPDGKYVASAGDDAEIRIWGVEARSPLRTLRGHVRRVIRVAFSPDGRTLASASRDHSVRLWDVDSGNLLHVLAGHAADVFAVVFSPDGRRLYSGSRDQTVRVWDRESGECLTVLAGHGQFVTSLSLSPDGARLVAGSWFGEILLWDLATHDLVASFKGHDGAIRAVAFSPDGRWLVSAAYDHSIRLFDSASPAARRAARQRAVVERNAAQAILDRLNGQLPTSALAAESINTDDAPDEPIRAWLRKLKLMRSLGAAEAR